MFESIVFGVPADWEPIPDAVLDELGPLPLEPGVPDGADHPDRIAEHAVAMAPGGSCLTLLATVPPNLLSPSLQAQALAKTTEISAHVAAVAHEFTAELAGPPTALIGTHDRKRDPNNFAAHDVAVATRTSVYAADATVDLARDLRTVLKASGKALRSGALTLAQAKVLWRMTAGMPADTAREVETRVLPRAPIQDVKRFTGCVRRACASLDPTWTHRARQARNEIVVEHRAHDDGVGTLFVQGPLEATTTIASALTAAAERTKDELGGTADARKLAAMRDWAETVLADPAGPRRHGRLPTVNIVVDYPTFLGLRDNPAEIPGVGPIPADAARWAAADGAPLRRLIVDPQTGHLLDYGRTTYVAPPPLADHLIATTIASGGPHSAVDAASCDIDHQPAFDDGGRTDPGHTTPVDRRWHRAKTHGGWTYIKDPQTAILTWRSPRGLTVEVHPHDYRPGPAP
ncbi:MAG TPA: DUF222 domain-containing protein [Mycobacteriales bacterium]|nr:DUF222 domain-containing protein [Mycobacteriales bacterium]